MATLPGIARSRINVIMVTIRTTIAACRIRRIRKPSTVRRPLYFLPNGSFVLCEGTGTVPSARRPRTSYVSLDEVPVFRVDVERGGLRDHAPQVVGDLGELVHAVRLPDHRYLLGQVVLPLVHRLR